MRKFVWVRQNRNRESRLRSVLFIKIKQVLKFLIEGDAQHQGQLGGGIELPRLDRADGVAGHAHHVGQLALGQARGDTRLLEAVAQDQGIIHERLPHQMIIQVKKHGPGKQQQAGNPHEPIIFFPDLHGTKQMKDSVRSK